MTAEEEVGVQDVVAAHQEVEVGADKGHQEAVEVE